jgi:hypothetical protein
MFNTVTTAADPDESLSPTYQLNIDEIDTHSFATLLTHQHGIALEKTAGIEFGFHTTGEQSFSSGSEVTGTVRIITPQPRSSKLTLDDAHPLYETEVSPLGKPFCESEPQIAAAQSVTVDAARSGRTTLPLNTNSTPRSGRLGNVVTALRNCENEVYVQVLVIPCSGAVGKLLSGEGKDKYADPHPEPAPSEYVALGILVAGKPTGDGAVTTDVANVTDAISPPTQNHPHTLKRINRDPTRAATLLTTPELRPSPTRLWWLTTSLSKRVVPWSATLQRFSPLHLGTPPKPIITPAESHWYLGESPE